MRPRLSRAPVFAQVLLLALLCVVAAQAVNAFVVVAMPEPPPRGFAVAQAARALKGERVRLRDGRFLEARVQSAAPGWAGETRPFDDVLRRLLAAELGAAPERVLVSVRLPDRRMARIAMHATLVRRQEEIRQEMRIDSDAPPGDLRPPETGRRELFFARGGGDVFKAAIFPPFSAAWRRPDGAWVLVEPPKALLSPWQLRLLFAFALTAVLVLPLAWLFATRLTRPIRAFAEAAERVGADPAGPPLATEGPLEVRTAVTAFNDMQAKIRAYVQGRTEMLAAIAHDLRTPLARLRFRAEGAPDAVRDRMGEDIAEMDAMIGSVLAFVRAETLRDERVRLDLSALVAAVVDDATERGGDARLTATESLTVVGDPLALKRLVTNLVENALKFAGAARVSLIREGAEAILAVEDDGPGLDEGELERVFEPFHRAERSRNRDTGGAGLGLAVARSLARAHGGDVRLRNRPGGGLRAEVRLPIG